ncbi:MAG: hypothetical protein LBC43_02815 [Bifidobacteriaceae bacterium]|nr:hypothetical protein [Bifidobacteriaceae bacterium]
MNKLPDYDPKMKDNLAGIIERCEDEERDDDFCGFIPKNLKPNKPIISIHIWGYIGFARIVTKKFTNMDFG